MCEQVLLCFFWNQGTASHTGNTAAVSPKLPSLGREQGKSKWKGHKTFHFWVAFFLIQHLLGCCKPLTVFWSSYKVGSDSFSLVSFFFFFGVSVGEHELTAYPLHQFGDIPPQLHFWEWFFLLLPSGGPGTWVILTKSTLTKSLNWCMTSAYCRVSLKGHGKQQKQIKFGKCLHRSYFLPIRSCKYRATVSTSQWKGC